jgi:hypothetical protein
MNLVLYVTDVCRATCVSLDVMTGRCARRFRHQQQLKTTQGESPHVILPKIFLAVVSSNATLAAGTIWVAYDVTTPIDELESSG